MLLNFKDTITIGQGSNAVGTQLPDGTVHIFYNNAEGTTEVKSAVALDAAWTNVETATVDSVAPSIKLKHASVVYNSGYYTWVPYVDQMGYQRTMVYPEVAAQMDSMFFRGFMTGVMTAQEIQKDFNMQLTKHEPVTNLRIPSYYNGFLVGLTVARSS